MIDMLFGLLKAMGGSIFYKDLVRRMANEFASPAKIERDVREILSKDLEFATTFFSLAPRSVNAVFGLVQGVNSYMSSFASDAVVGLLRGVAKDLNAVYAAKAVNDFFDQMERLRKDHPKLIAELLGDRIGEFIDTLDFGKMKKFVEDSAYCTYGTFEIVNEKIFGNPVKLGNLVSSVPAVLNAGIAISNDAIRRVELPSEVLASALFATLTKVDVEQMGKMLSNVSTLINKVHEGNYILGKGDRKFKEIAETTMEKFLNSMDVEEFRKAVNAILEDLNDFSDALNNALWKNPLTMMALAPLAPTALNLLMGIGSKALSKFNELPPDLSAQITTSLMKEIDTKKLGEILTGIAKVVNGVAESDPKAISNILNSAIASSDKKELEKMLNNLVRSIVDVIASNPQILSALAIPLLQSFAGLVGIKSRSEG
ncbi:MAG: hypothetical protein NZ879_04210 [Archaeoglobaceae archaeon]|nr:hypothetical protein [Archaeoglobaceae archaeon]MDW8118167.1 hypothetical protein [Archaeoglobaceae archaeon]